jgi:hypothetical protein
MSLQPAKCDRSCCAGRLSFLAGFSPKCTSKVFTFYFKVHFKVGTYLLLRQFQFRCLRCRLSGDSRIRAGVGFSLTFRFVGFALVSEVATTVFFEVATTARKNGRIFQV